MILDLIVFEYQRVACKRGARVAKLYLSWRVYCNVLFGELKETTGYLGEHVERLNLLHVSLHNLYRLKF